MPQKAQFRSCVRSVQPPGWQMICQDMWGSHWEHHPSQHTLQARSCMGLAILCLGQVSSLSSSAALVFQWASNPWARIVPTHRPQPMRLMSQTMAAQGAVPVPCPSPCDLTYEVTTAQVQNLKESSSLWASWNCFVEGFLHLPGKTAKQPLGQNKGLPT